MAFAATIKFNGNKNCFLTSSNFLSKSGKDVKELQVFEVQYGQDKHAYLSLSTESNNTGIGDEIELNGLYGNKLGISDGDEVYLKQVRNPVNARQVSVEPLAVDDWEILEQHAVFVENRMLDQLRVVWKGQVFPLWVTRGVCIFLSVVNITPNAKCALLDTATDVIVSPKIRNHSLQPSSPCVDTSKQVYENNLTPPTRREKFNSDPFPKAYAQRRNSHTLSRKSSDVSPTKKDKPRPLFRRQSSLMENLWNYMSSWLPISDYYTTDLEMQHRSMEVGEKERFVLQRHNFVFRTQAMKFECNPEELLNESVLQNIPKALRRVKRRKKYPINIRGSTLDKEFLHAEDQNRQTVTTPELFQPSMVFVQVEDVYKQTETNFVQANLPRVFYAQIRKLPSPKEAVEEGKQKTTKRTKSAAAADRSSDKNKEKKEDKKGSERGDHCEAEVCAIVRVVTVDRQGLLCESSWTDCVERLYQEQPFLAQHVLLPDLLRRQMKLDVTGRVWLQTVQSDPLQAKKIQLFPLSVVPRRVSPYMITMAFKTWVRHCSDETHPIVVYQGMMVKFMIIAGIHLEAQLTFTSGESTSSQEYTFLHAENVDNMVISVQRDIPKDDTVISPLLPFRYVADFDPMVPIIQLRSLGGISKLAEQALYHLEATLCARPLSKTMFEQDPGLHNGILLITGPKGSGKSYLAKALCRQLAELPVMAHTAVIDCKPLRGRRVENMQKALETLIDEAAWRQPAIILLDDLDVIAGAASGPEAEMSGEALYAAKVAEMIKSLVKFEINNDSCIALIATSQSAASLHPSLMSSRGTHFIQETITINPPDKEGRKEMLAAIIQNKSCVGNSSLKSIDLDSIVNRTEGFVVRDLEHVVNKAIHAKFLADSSVNRHQEMHLTQSEFDTALDGFRPSSIRNVQLHTAGELSWEDIGGLTEVKKTLVETLQWPSKYPELFRRCPLRLRSGLLLYGAPGTGKTLLAGVVAKECCLNFISIKGPELLSKYIGASEQAVRDLFTRAQSAKPCILFFDEFDSIAPRRGHDSTGVTDRVVNQLLTQLDGVEGLEGVYVLAATSRPDLLDPALLRPGRLDKSLHCELPNERERGEILKSLTRRMNLGPECDLQRIAKQAEYFTGADFKALLYNSQLKAIHEATSTSSPLSPRSGSLRTPDSKSKGGNSFSFDGLPGSEMSDPVNKIKTILSPVNEEQTFEKHVAVTTYKAASSPKLAVKDGPRKKKPSKYSASFTGVSNIRTMERVTYIPKLEEGPSDLTVEDEDKMLTMIQEIYRRENIKLKSDDQRKGAEPDTTHHMITVTQTHLQLALDSMRPSVSEQERAKYKYIYENFVSSRSGDFTAGSPSGGKRATLA